jgi:DNA protecting protein DprA
MESRYTLHLQAAPGVGTATQRTILDFAHRHGMTLHDFFALSDLEWRRAGLNQQQAASLAAPSIAVVAERWTNELARNSIQVIHLYQEQYPEQLKRVLGKAAPPILTLWGNHQLLSKPAVGWCGSRDASPQGIDFTRDTVEQAVERGITVVSGAARGIDTAAHYTALANGGTTIVVAPEGILNFRFPAEIKAIAAASNTLVISEFQPNARWSTANAMTRNHTLIGLSNALIVVESGTKGGTYEAGSFALKMKLPLFVAQYAQPSDKASGNAYFIAQGAIPIWQNREDQQANLKPLFNDILTHYDRLKRPPTPTIIQGDLFAL